MNKEELVKATSQEAGLTQAVARKCIDAVFKVIANTLKKGEEVRLVGFGTFKVKERKEKKGRNPRTKEEIVIPAKKVVKFIPGKDLSL